MKHKIIYKSLILILIELFLAKNIFPQETDDNINKNDKEQNSKIPTKELPILEQVALRKNILRKEELKDAKNKFNYALMLYSEDKYNSAKIAFEELINIYPNDPHQPEALFYIANILEKEEKIENSLSYYNKIYINDSNSEISIKSYLQMGRINLRLGNQSKAVEIFNTISQEFKNKFPNLARAAQVELYSLGIENKTNSTGKI